MRKYGLPVVFLMVGLLFSLKERVMTAQAGRATIERPSPRVVSSLSQAVSDPQGALVLVFFSLECPVCWEELFEVRDFVFNYSIPIDLVGVTLDQPEVLEPFLRKFGFLEPVVSDRQRELYRRFRVGAEPWVVIIENDLVLYRDRPTDDQSARREKARQCLLGIRDRSRS